MNKYKVLVATTIEDVERVVDEVVELSEEAAAPLVAEGRLELVADEAASTEEAKTGTEGGGESAE